MLWRDHYSIGMKQIDEQHKQMILSLEDLLKALEKGGAQAERQCRSMADYMDSFVVVHFRTEEMFQQKIGYSLHREHKALHKEFAERIHSAKHDLIRSDYAPKAMAAYAQLLTRWLIYHIMNEDKKIQAEMSDILPDYS